MTYQRPAYEEITIALGGNAVALRPSLRAAATLVTRHDFPALFRALDEGDFTVISEIILAASSSRQDAAAFLDDIAGKPLSPFFDAVRTPLAELIGMFLPAPVQSLDKPSTAAPMPMAELYRQLYRLATGVLGWIPAAAWEATPTEISEACAAKLGIGEKQPDNEQAARNEAAGLDPEFDRDGLRALKMKIAGGK